MAPREGCFPALTRSVPAANRFTQGTWTSVPVSSPSSRRLEGPANTYLAWVVGGTSRLSRASSGSARCSRLPGRSHVQHEPSLGRTDCDQGTPVEVAIGACDYVISLAGPRRTVRPLGRL